MKLGSEIRELPIRLSREEVIRLLGYAVHSAPPARTEGILAPVIEEARGLARGRGVFVRLPPDRARSVGLEPIEASGLVVGLVTIGAAIEERVGDYLKTGETTRALVLDAAGSAAVEEATDRLGTIIALGEPAAPRGRATAHADPGGALRTAPSGRGGAPAIPIETASSISCRVSPGYGGWELTAQTALFGLLPHHALGVDLLPSLLMVPRKSISFAMWLGAEARPFTGLSACARCGLDGCLYRRQKR